MKTVLDASALLRYTDQEAGGERVRELLAQGYSARRPSVISAAMSEVVYTFHRRFGIDRAAELLDPLRRLPIEIVSVDEAFAGKAAELRHSYKLPFGDSFAAALAQLLEATLVTADYDFKDIADAGVITAEFLPTKA